MLRRCVSAAAVSLCLLAFSSSLIASPPVPVSARAKRFARSLAVRELPSLPGIPREEKLGEDRDRENEELPRSRGPYRPGATGEDHALQGPIPSPNMPGPSVNFAGLSADDDAALFGFRLAPPDTNGDVGPNHYVQTVNTIFRVYDKAGNPLVPAAKLSDLFAPLGAPCGTRNDGDPIVLYDPMADRWLISQFCIPVFLPTPADHAHQVIAISQTGDPTGAYFLYDFLMPNAKLNDYPHFGVWPDGYYMSDNQFGDGTGSQAYTGAGLFAFERLKMLQGDPTASFIYFDYEATDPTAGGMLPTDMDGFVPPPAGTPNFFMETRADEFGDPIDALRIYEFHADFANPASSTLTVRPDLPIAAFDQRQPSGRQDIEEPPGGETLDSIGDRMMFRISYRTLSGGVQSLVASFTVNVSGTDPTSAATYQAGVRFEELRRDSGTGAFSVQNETTYSTDAGNGATGRNLWCGSAAQDNQGNVAVGFSASSTTLNPSIVWAGRLASDPPNSLAQGEATVQAGVGVQTSGANRWGDYSSMSVDPADDCTFWYTQEYYANSGSFDWATRVAAFSFPSCTTPPRGTVSGQVTNCVGGAPIPGVTVSTAEGFLAVTDATGHYSITMPPGNYTLNFSKNGFTGAAAGAAVTNGNNTTVDLCLTGFPILEAAGTSLVAETCSPPNNALDPGELVTVSICVQNTGGVDTTDLTGTLLPGNGVGSPPPPIDFGIVTAGGAPVCKNFTFRVESLCGEAVKARVHLVDGASDLGILEYDYVTGALTVSFSENFDTVTAPNLPSGWVASNGPGSPAPFWVTSTTTPDTAPNDAFVDDPAVVSDKSLASVSIPIGSPAAVLTFRHSYNLEASGGNPAVAFDGGVLEMSIDGAAFQDIVDAGGSFTSNGYNRTISNNFQNPLAGRSAWSGNSGGYVTTVVQLPAAANGHNVKLRFRMGSDNSNGAPGWFVDTISVQAAYTCCSLPVPVALAVDTVASSGSSNLNGVFEPGEQVTVAPTWMNGGSTGVLAVSGIASNYTGPAGATYTLNDSSAAYGSLPVLTSADCITGGGGDCYQMSLDNPVVRPAAHWDATFGENANLAIPAGVAPTKTWTLHVGASFADVPASNIFYRYIETIFHNGVTGGCGAPGYCPTGPALRKQMAVFLLKSRFGSDYVPPAAVGIFGDVPPADPFAPWIEDLYNRGITGGCSVSPLNYCPNNTVLRQQMAVFLLKTLEGSGYVPPACAGIFGDVPCPSTFADWIEDLAGRGITGGCGSGNFCPTAPNTRGQMAVFLTKTFGLLLYGP